MKKRFMGLFKLMLFINILVLPACKPNEVKVKRIGAGEFDMEGKFIDGIIPDGVVKYYLSKTNNLVGTKEFDRGILNGKCINYFNSRIIQVANYKNGLEFGLTEHFDSTLGYLKQKDFYYYGKNLGPSYSFGENGELLFYSFSNFENKVLFSVEYDSTENRYYSDDIENLGVLNVNEVLFNNKKMLRIFLYLIYPPKAKVEYKLYYLNQQDAIVDSVAVASNHSEVFWENYINYPENNQRVALFTTKYDSVLKKSRTLINYIESYKQK